MVEMIAREIGKTNMSEDGTLFTPVTYGMYQFMVKTEKLQDAETFKHTVRLAFIAQNNNERTDNEFRNALDEVVMSHKFPLYETGPLSRTAAIDGHEGIVRDVSERADIYLDQAPKAFERGMGTPWRVL
jgi:hypothetical protein